MTTFSVTFPSAVMVPGYDVIDDGEPVRGAHDACIKPVLRQGEKNRVLSLDELKMRAIEERGDLGIRDLNFIMQTSVLPEDGLVYIFPGTILERDGEVFVPYTYFDSVGLTRGFRNLKEGFTQHDRFFCLC